MACTSDYYTCDLVFSNMYHIYNFLAAKSMCKVECSIANFLLPKFTNKHIEHITDQTFLKDDSHSCGSLEMTAKHVTKMTGELP